MKRRFSLTIALLIPVLAFALASGIPPATNREYYTRITATLARELPREHLSRREITDEIIQQTISNYLESLDFSHAYFLQADIERFEAFAPELHDMLLDGDNSFAFEVYELFKERVQNRTEYVEQILDEGFDFSVDETYRWKRREAPWSADERAWSADERAWNEMWRKRIKNEYLRRMLQDTSPATNELARTEGPAPQSAPQSTSTGTPQEAEASAATNRNDQTEAAPPPEDEQAPQSETASLQDPDTFIRDNYKQYQHIIDDADAEWILQKFLSSFARAFDPHCDYMFPATEEDFEIDMKLSLVGIGALLRPEDGAARIVSLIPGGPASKDTREQRLRPGDKIIAVAQDEEEPVNILHWPLYRTVRLIRGEAGTRVVLTVIPASDPSGVSTKTVDLVREEVKLEDREAKAEIRTIEQPEDGESKRIGIITLPTFYADMQGQRFNPAAKSSSRDVARILRDMRQEGVDGIALDLRNNGGGSLIESILMTGLFIEAGPVVQVKERRKLNIIPNNDPTVAYNGPLVILVNRVSASASEILAAALQDYGRALIIGDSKTHGKGSVQTVTPLSRKDDSGSIKVTTALFYRISGGSTQLRGVAPDIHIPSAYESTELGEEFLDNPLEWSSVKPAMYSVFSEIPSILDVLQEQSLARRNDDSRYQARQQLLARIRDLNKTETISLHLEQRRQFAQTEKELTDIQNQLMDQESQDAEADEDDTPLDLVKEEALRILADWVDIRAERVGRREAP